MGKILRILDRASATVLSPLCRMSVFSLLSVILVSYALLTTLGVNFLSLDTGMELALFVVILTLVYLLLAHRISRYAVSVPLESVETVAKAMSIGDLSKNLEVAGTKEIRSAFTQFNEAIVGLQAFIAKINEQADVVHAASRELSANSAKNSEAAIQVIASMEDLATGATEQTESLAHAAESVQLLTMLIKQVSQDSRQVSEMSHRLADAAKTGQNLSQDVDHQINQIYLSTQDIAKVVQELNHTTADIGKITAEIKEIAEHTSLLALNASIEAAHAGEHGKGFAVVAGETGKLAKRSMDATVMIHNLLKHMQQRNAEIVSVIDQGIEQVNSGRALTKSSMTRFEEIFDMLKESTVQIEAIAQSAVTIESQSNSVTETITSISAFSEQIMASTEEVLAVGQEQNEYTRQVAQMSGELTDTANILKQSILVYLSFSFFGTKARTEATQKALAVYMEQNAHIRFSIDDSAKDSKVYFPALLSQFEQGTAADLLQINTWLTELKEQGDYLADLSQESALDLSGFDPEVLKLGMLDGKLQALPTGLNALGLMVNNNFLSEHGIPDNTVWNWEKLLEAGASVHAKNSNDYLLFSSVEYVYHLMKMFIRQKTGRQFILDDYSIGFDQSTLKDMYTYFKQLVDSGAMQTAVPDTGGIELHNYGLWCTWVSDYPKVVSGIFKGKNVTVAMPPVSADAKVSAIQIKPQLLLAVNKETRNLREVTRFLHWIYNEPEGIKAWGINRGYSPTTTARKVLEEEKLVDPAVTNGLQLALEQGGSPENVLSGHAEVVALFMETNQKVFAGTLELDAACAELMTKLIAKLKQLKKRSKKGSSRWFGR
jgi:methyl-accepting chemotaxis protein